jgi:hypothetical protein
MSAFGDDTDTLLETLMKWALLTLLIRSATLPDHTFRGFPVSVTLVVAFA